MSKEKEYSLVVNGKRYSVPYEVYKAYYIAYEQERYLKKKINEFERSLERFDEDGIYAELQHVLSLPSLEDEVSHRQTLADLSIALDSLDNDERMLINELFFNAKSERQLAAQIGIPRMTICSRKNKILGKLKKLIEI